ncbi:uncharacterized protein LY89DRAFT_449846 [Mollisia scopiformis]|uniref:Uncharacterized protein n=1 Tax=Mollisia scopiformis TaxID=149040 RepID=A0A194XK97_MOLSC|nr:uncharacterized protein LY89DRAFT_449846 [Mollisia scopiformis]KUJ20635.1 hypothetical protein LY89DRAFT_449846 [Mollisia scopiformis]
MYDTFAGLQSAPRPYFHIVQEFLYSKTQLLYIANFHANFLLYPRKHQLCDLLPHPNNTGGVIRSSVAPKQMDYTGAGPRKQKRTSLLLPPKNLSIQVSNQYNMLAWLCWKSFCLFLFSIVFFVFLVRIQKPSMLLG